MKSYTEAFREGMEAVRSKPHVEPRNPYSEFKDDEEQAARGWDAGAIEAGIGEIYTNGILDKEHQS